MIDLLGILGGAVTRLIPLGVDYFKEGRELKYEILRMEKQKELEELRADNALNEIRAATESSVDTSWATALVEAQKLQTQVTGDKWLDRVNVSVRPVLTYWWCIVLYTINKFVLFYAALKADLTLDQTAPILFTDFDAAVVGSIIGFWFVDRALRAKNA